MTSMYMVRAKRYAQNLGCQPPVATMIARAPTYEAFAIKCSTRSQLLVRCDYGHCETQDWRGRLEYAWRQTVFQNARAATTVADIDLRSIVGSWQDTVDDALILDCW